jgi:hypothetical protein
LRPAAETRRLGPAPGVPGSGHPFVGEHNNHLVAVTDVCGVLTGFLIVDWGRGNPDPRRPARLNGLPDFLRVLAHVGLGKAIKDLLHGFPDVQRGLDGHPVGSCVP